MTIENTGGLNPEEVIKNLDGGLDGLVTEIKTEIGVIQEENPKGAPEETQEAQTARLEAQEKIKNLETQTAQLDSTEEIFLAEATYYAVAGNPEGYEKALKQRAQINTARNNLVAEKVILGEESGVAKTDWGNIRASEGIEGIKKNALRNRDDHNKNNIYILETLNTEDFKRKSAETRDGLKRGDSRQNEVHFLLAKKSAENPEELARNLQRGFTELFEQTNINGGYEARFDSKGMIPSHAGCLEQGYGLALAALESSDPKTAAIALAFTEGVRTMPPHVLEGVKAKLAKLNPEQKRQFVDTLEVQKNSQVNYRGRMESAGKRVLTVEDSI